MEINSTKGFLKNLLRTKKNNIKFRLLISNHNTYYLEQVKKSDEDCYKSLIFTTDRISTY